MRIVNFYKVLRVPRDAPIKLIRSNFRKLARELHPDLNKCDQRQEELKLITEAYTTLSHPDKRRRYDQQLAMSEPQHASSDPFSHRRRSAHSRPPPRSSTPMTEEEKAFRGRVREASSQVLNTPVFQAYRKRREKEREDLRKVEAMLEEKARWEEIQQERMREREREERERRIAEEQEEREREEERQRANQAYRAPRKRKSERERDAELRKHREELDKGQGGSCTVS